LGNWIRTNLFLVATIIPQSNAVRAINWGEELECVMEL
jgi:hypothetical protein